MFEFLDHDDWAVLARSPFGDEEGNYIKRNIISSIENFFPELGGVAQDRHRTTYYGHHFLQSQDGPIQGGNQPINRAAWFGFVNANKWLRNNSRGYSSELVIAYRMYNQYRLDGVQFKNLFIRVGADPLLCGRNKVPNQIAWIVNFDETWDKEKWIEAFKLVHFISAGTLKPPNTP